MSSTGRTGSGMNPMYGLMSGVGLNSYKNYTPTLLCAANGAVTAPTDGTGAASRGRYAILPNGTCTVQVQINRGITGTTGTGDCYVVDLPLRAKRLGGGVNIIGQAMHYRTVSARPWENYMAVALADSWSSLGGEEDRYCQFYLPLIKANGTGTWTASAASATVTHGMGYTPSAADISVTLTSSPSSAAVGSMGWYINGITSTQFVLNAVNGSAIGTVDTTFSWMVRSTPNTGVTGAWLAGPNRPWAPSFDSVFYNVIYEMA